MITSVIIYNICNSVNYMHALIIYSLNVVNYSCLVVIEITPKIKPEVFFCNKCNKLTNRYSERVSNTNINLRPKVTNCCLLRYLHIVYEVFAPLVFNNNLGINGKQKFT